MAFNFNGLPRELRDSVFQNVSLFSALDFLKINLDLRDYVLFHGPFTRTLDQFSLKFHQISFENSFNLSFTLPSFTMKLFSKGEKMVFVFAENLLTIQGFSRPIFVEKPLILFNLINTCRFLKIKLFDEPENDSVLGEYFLKTHLVNLLPNLKILPNAHLDVTVNLASFRIFTKNFNPIITTSLRLELGYLETDESKDFDEEIEKFLENEKRNQTSVLITSSPQIYLDQFTKTSPEMIIIYNGEEYFRDFIEDYLEKGFPCKNPNTGLLVFSNERKPGQMSFEEFFNFIIEKVVSREDFQWNIDFVEENSLEAQPFNEFFMRRFEKFGGEFVKGYPYIHHESKFTDFRTLNREYKYKAMFKREIPMERTIFYMMTLEEIDEEYCTVQLMIKRF